MSRKIAAIALLALLAIPASVGAAGQVQAKRAPTNAELQAEVDGLKSELTALRRDFATHRHAYNPASASASATDMGAKRTSEPVK